MKKLLAYAVAGALLLVAIPAQSQVLSVARMNALQAKKQQIAQNILNSFEPYKADSDVKSYLVSEVLTSLLKPGAPMNLAQFFSFEEINSDLIEPSGAKLSADQLAALKKQYDSVVVRFESE